MDFTGGRRGSREIFSADFADERGLNASDFVTICVQISPAFIKTANLR
jgi:hypothetical protein